ncbi:SDR family oxidoreductase [Streptomyces sp. NPDC058378]|uniref:SDR family oxidoreductase n=1 Tax=unclassified Streptomyces TaxID=2593676 RepID=UPI003655BAC0
MPRIHGGPGPATAMAHACGEPATTSGRRPAGRAAPLAGTFRRRPGRRDQLELRLDRPADRRHLLGLLLDGDEAPPATTPPPPRRLPATVVKSAPSISAYATSKLALARWVRRTAVTPEWGRRGVLLDAIAPGAVITPLMTGSTDVTATPDPDSFPTPMPLGIFGQADGIAFRVEQFLRPEARFTTGSILYVDGGTDAAMRTEAQPTAMSPVTRGPGLPSVRSGAPAAHPSR